jgi:hypothetical protein
MNKLFGLFLLALAFLTPVPADAACSGGACFWIGGAGTLDNSTDGAHWATTSGGATCSCVPATTDTITFDASSGTGTVTMNVGGGTWTIASLTLSNFNGTLDQATNTNSIVMTGSYTNSSSVVRAHNVGTGTITISGANSIWNIVTGTNLTLTAGSSTIAFTAVGSTSQRRFFGGGKTYGTITVSSATAGSFFIAGAPTIGTFTPSAPNRLFFDDGTTTTITTFSGLTCNSTNQCLVSSDDTSSNNVATVSSGNNWTCTYCSINQMTFSGGGTFTGANSFNTGSNTGIAITPPTAGGGGGGRIIGG